MFARVATTIMTLTLAGVASAVLLASAKEVARPTAVSATASQPVIYPTYGVHNPPNQSPCTYPDCVYKRGPGEPSDPHYPVYWTSHWDMYRVFRQYQQYPPPYDGKPPSPLKDGVDYQTSHGATYYDSLWSGRAGRGAMMEHYEKYCLPIFPIPNNFTCSFISLGDIAYFVTYPSDRPKGMPPVCLFSDVNHPPRQDFIIHLPYSRADSERLHGRIQGYSFWVSGKTGKPIQVGVSPDRTAEKAIMFGYAFWSTSTDDRAGTAQVSYRHPQSFYFSGYPGTPPNAPIVSQNYTDFAMTKPDPKQTWDQVAGLDPSSLPRCQLFNAPSSALSAAAGVEKPYPTWGDIGQFGK